MSGNLEQLLGVPSDLMEEVAIVICGGCPRGWELPATIWSVNNAAVPLSLPSLYAGVAVCRRRLFAAHAVIGLSACALDCVSRLLTSIRAPDVALIAPEYTSLAEVTEHMANAIVRLCASPRRVVIGELITLDCRGLKCPVPIAKLTKTLKSLGPGEGVNVAANDPSFRPDLEAWCRETGNTLEHIQREGDTVFAVVRRPTRLEPSRFDGTGLPGSSGAIDAPTETLDYRGLKCPMPIIKLGQQARSMGNGTVVVIADDPAFPPDIRAWCDQTGATLLSLDGDVDGTVEASILLSPQDQADVHDDRPTEDVASGDLPMLGRLDQRGLRSPMHIVQLGEFARTHEGPGLVELTTGDPTIEMDLKNWCERTGGALVGLSRSGDEITGIVAINLRQPKSRKISEPPHAPSPPSPRPSQITVGSTGVHETLDCRGLRCPLPILRLNEMAKTSSGASVEVVADDPAFPADLLAWCQRNGTQISSLERQGSLATARLELPGPASGPASVTAKAPSKRPGPKRPPVVPPAGRPAEHMVSIERLDCRGLKCPMPIVRINEIAKRGGVEVIEVMANDAAFPPDVKAWCQQAGAELELIQTSPGVYRAVIRTGASRGSKPPMTPRGSSPPMAPRGSSPPMAPRGSSPPMSPRGSSPPMRQSSSDAPSMQAPMSLDFRGLKCPMPILGLNKELAKTKAELVDVVADDPAFPSDIAAWCQAKGFELVWAQEEGAGYRARLRRRSEVGASSPQGRR